MAPKLFETSGRRPETELQEQEKRRNKLVDLMKQLDLGRLAYLVPELKSYLKVKEAGALEALGR